MKKFLIILLALSCAFTMFSCGDDAPSLKDFTAAVDATSPTAVTITVTSETALGPLSASFKTTYADDGSFTIEYSQEKFNPTTEGESGEYKSTVSGTVTCDKNGNYSDGGAFTGSNPVATGAKLNLNSKKMTATVSDDGNVLSAEIKAANTKAVLGIEYAYDVYLTITKNDGKIVSYTMNYTTETGEVKVVCNYQ